MGRPLVIVAGQSNCYNYIDHTLDDAAYSSLPYTAWKNAMVILADPRQRRIPWAPHRATESHSSGGVTTWPGPDLVIAKVLGDAGHTPTTIFDAMGNTSLAVDWAATTGPMYVQIVYEIARAFVSTKNPGGYSSSWLVWIQGENDGGSAPNTAAYKTNFDAFWSALKADLAVSCPGLRCVVVKLGTQMTAVTQLTDMRTRYDEIVAAHADVFAYDSTPCAISGDNVHYSKAGVVTLGTGIANAMIAAGSL